MTRYWGGKKRLAKELAPVIENTARLCYDKQAITFYWEPFAGMYSVGFELMERQQLNPALFIASDKNQHVMNLFQSLKDKTFDPPAHLDHKEYLALKQSKHLFSPLHVLTGHACGFQWLLFGRLQRLSETLPIRFSWFH